jgi:maleylpyruvate isomerase
MTNPTGDLDALRGSTAALLDGLAAEGWSDADARAASLLPGWSRGHVLTHLARNADAVAHTVAGALRGEHLPRYPHGVEGRNADIEAGAGRPLRELLDDVGTSAANLDGLLARAADAGAWDVLCDEWTIGAYVTARWREVEIHRLDLRGSYRADQWPAAFVSSALPTLLDGLGGRSERPLTVVVAADGSLTADLPGRSWTTGPDGSAPGDSPVTVTGPDWALLAWAAGRPDAVGDVLGAAPELARWR